MWVLILLVHVGVLGDGNSNSVVTQEFASQQKCVEAAEDMKKKVSRTVKEVIYTCAPK